MHKFNYMLNVIHFLLQSKQVKLFSMILLIGVMSLLTAPTYASSKKPYTTIGSRSCKTWIADRQKSLTGTGIDLFADHGGRSWLLGFLSALNASSIADIDLLAAIDADTATFWVDRYCATNPNKDLTDAAYVLFIELLKIEVKKLENKHNRLKK